MIIGHMFLYQYIGATKQNLVIIGVDNCVINQFKEACFKIIMITNYLLSYKSSVFMRCGSQKKNG